jgi:hypothetical protein
VVNETEKRRGRNGGKGGREGMREEGWREGWREGRGREGETEIRSRWREE